MTINSTCDLFPGKDPNQYSNLQIYMVDWCLNKMQEIRLEEMSIIKTSGVQYTAFGFICLWALCSYVSLFIAVYKWCFAERTGFKMRISTLMLVSFLLVTHSVILKKMNMIFIHQIMGVSLFANLSVMWTLNVALDMCGEDYE